MRHFPRASRPDGISVERPDAFLLERLQRDQEAVLKAVDAMARRHRAPPHTALDLAGQDGRGPKHQEIRRSLDRDFGRPLRRPFPMRRDIITPEGGHRGTRGQRLLEPPDGLRSKPRPFRVATGASLTHSQSSKATSSRERPGILPVAIRKVAQCRPHPECWFGGGQPGPLGCCDRTLGDGQALGVEVAEVEHSGRCEFCQPGHAERELPSTPIGHMSDRRSGRGQEGQPDPAAFSDTSTTGSPAAAAPSRAAKGMGGGVHRHASSSKFRRPNSEQPAPDQAIEALLVTEELQGPLAVWHNRRVGAVV